MDYHEHTGKNTVECHGTGGHAGVVLFPSARPLKRPDTTRRAREVGQAPFRITRAGVAQSSRWGEDNSSSAVRCVQPRSPTLRESQRGGMRVGGGTRGSGSLKKGGRVTELGGGDDEQVHAVQAAVRSAGCCSMRWGRRRVAAGGGGGERGGALARVLAEVRAAAAVSGAETQGR